MLFKQEMAINEAISVIESDQYIGDVEINLSYCKKGPDRYVSIDLLVDYQNDRHLVPIHLPDSSLEYCKKVAGEVFDVIKEYDGTVSKSVRII